MFDNIAKVRAMRFPESEEEDANPWRNLCFIIPDNTRPALLSGLGWGSGKTPNEGEGCQSNKKKKSTEKKKKKKCVIKPRKRKSGKKRRKSN